MIKLVIVVLALAMLGALVGLFASMKNLAGGHSDPSGEADQALKKRKQFMRSGFLFITSLSGLILVLAGFGNALVILLALAVVTACFEAAVANLKP